MVAVEGRVGGARLSLKRGIRGQWQADVRFGCRKPVRSVRHAPEAAVVVVAPRFPIHSAPHNPLRPEAAVVVVAPRFPISSVPLAHSSTATTYVCVCAWGSGVAWCIRGAPEAAVVVALIPFKIGQPKKQIVSKTVERDFEREYDKLQKLEEQTKKLHKDMKKSTEADTAMSKAAVKISGDLLSNPLCEQDQSFLEFMTALDTAMKRMDAFNQEKVNQIQKTVIDPLKKYSSVFPSLNMAVKRREQALQDYKRLQAKVEKYEEKEKTGPIMVKLHQLSTTSLSGPIMVKLHQPKLWPSGPRNGGEQRRVEEQGRVEEEGEESGGEENREEWKSGGAEWSGGEWRRRVESGGERRRVEENRGEWRSGGAEWSGGEWRSGSVWSSSLKGSHRPLLASSTHVCSLCGEQQAREELRPVREDFEAKNKQLLDEMPKFYHSRIDYFQPSFEALIRAQVVYFTEMHKIFSDLTDQIDQAGLTDEQRERENESKLNELRALSIVADD
ncbi:hypothetical protein ACEWY4_011716 [Coilia grayii]|uniref:BAR domain-containing protein n=1 Tax=Coilia grayii TaxID=363190 RepID=A0ABD1JYG3_9TELE